MMPEYQRKVFLKTSLVTLIVLSCASAAFADELSARYDCSLLRTIGSSTTTSASRVNGFMKAIFSSGAIGEFATSTTSPMRLDGDGKDRTLVIMIGGRVSARARTVKLCSATIMLIDDFGQTLSSSVGQNQGLAAEKYCRDLTVGINSTFNMGPLQAANTSESVTLMCSVSFVKSPLKN